MGSVVDPGLLLDPCVSPITLQIWLCMTLVWDYNDRPKYPALGDKPNKGDLPLKDIYGICCVLDDTAGICYRYDLL